MKFPALILGLLIFCKSQAYDYDVVLSYSLLFYEAQRSGHLPSNNRIPWRGDSMLNDTGENGWDLTGGYFDAGDHIKFGFPMAVTATILGWGLLDYTEGYKMAQEYDNGLATLRWATDYLIKAHPTPNEFYAQVGDVTAEHIYWGRPEDYKKPRPYYKLSKTAPGSDLVGETSAALAVASLVFKESGDLEYAKICLKHAQDLYNFANMYWGKYSDNIGGEICYLSTGFRDELAWAAAWLYKATGRVEYLIEAKSHFNFLKHPFYFNWDIKSAGVQILLAQLTKEKKYKDGAEKYCDKIFYHSPRTPKGLIHLNYWGPLKNIADALLICMQTADFGINHDAYYNFSYQQINYMLGDTGRSYVVGYGVNPPTRVHHRSSSCSYPPEPCERNSPKPNPHILTGALVGGPDKYDNYVDNRTDYVHNEVAIDYNAGFTSVLAGLIQQFGTSK